MLHSHAWPLCLPHARLPACVHAPPPPNTLALTCRDVCSTVPTMISKLVVARLEPSRSITSESNTCGSRSRRRGGGGAL